MSDILTPAALAEIRERAARTHAEWLDAEWLKDCPNAMLHAARDAHMLLAEHDRLRGILTAVRDWMDGWPDPMPADVAKAVREAVSPAPADEESER